MRTPPPVSRVVLLRAMVALVSCGDHRHGAEGPFEQAFSDQRVSAVAAASGPISEHRIVQHGSHRRLTIRYRTGDDDWRSADMGPHGAILVDGRLRLDRSEDGQWLRLRQVFVAPVVAEFRFDERLHGWRTITEAEGARREAIRAYPGSFLAYVDLLDGTVLDGSVATEAERRAGLFTLYEDAGAAQVVRGRRLCWIEVPAGELSTAGQ